MRAETRFVLDANVLIQAHRTYYAFDICPGYWTALLVHHDGERLCSIDRVRSELLAGERCACRLGEGNHAKRILRQIRRSRDHRLVRPDDGLGTGAILISAGR